MNVLRRGSTHTGVLWLSAFFQSIINLKYTIKMKKDYSNSGSITVNNSFGETWTCTNQLRWKQVECNMGNGTAMNINELQQLWRSDIGSEKWEAVPFVL